MKRRAVLGVGLAMLVGAGAARAGGCGCDDDDGDGAIAEPWEPDRGDRASGRRANETWSDLAERRQREVMRSGR